MTYLETKLLRSYHTDQASLDASERLHLKQRDFLHPDGSICPDVYDTLVGMEDFLIEFSQTHDKRGESNLKPH